MNIRRIVFRSLFVLALGSCCLLPFFHARAQTAAPAQVPAIIQKGFSLWAKNREASWAFDTWQLGGLMERDAKTATLTRYFAKMDITLGAYKSYDVIQTKHVSENSAVLYLAVNLDRAVMFGRFMLYRTDKDWVVQNMDFSAKPEALMPWMAFDGETYTQ
jgi:hypothetical protein